MRKISTLLVLSIVINLIAPIAHVFANYNSLINELQRRNVCDDNQFEVVMVNQNGTLTSFGCYNSYDEAKVIMNNTNSTITSVGSIISYKSYDGGITTVKELIDTKYGMLDLRTKPNAGFNTNLFSSAISTSASNYFNGYYGTDAPLIEYDHPSRRVKMKISGYTGWIRKFDPTHEGYRIVPVSLVRAPAYYYVASTGNLIHVLTQDVKSDSGYDWNWFTNLGPAPSFIRPNIKYYSYDGNYFYTDLITMINDYKNNTYVNAINASNIYYNYYQYLPYRTKTSYTATDINEYIKSRGYIRKPIGTSAGAGESMLYGEGPNFIESQDKFGANALLSLSLSINESGWGRSTIAVNKKNIFGHGAFDYDPFGAADSYSDVKYSILYHSDIWVSYGYAHPSDSRYNGSHFGNKASGMNINYASDPYWGEKMAGHYFNFDRALGMQDYKLYQIGLKKTIGAVNIRKEPTTTSAVLYQLKSNVIDMPVIILEEVSGETIDGNNKWYRIQSDPALDDNRNQIPIPDKKDPNRPIYDWNNSYAYIHSSVIDIIGEESQFVKKDGIFYFDKLEWNQTKETLNFRGYLTVKGVNNSRNLLAAYSLILKDTNDKNKEYILPLNRWINSNEYPFQIPNQDGYDYSSSWFNAEISLKNIPQGDYVAYVRARTNKAETTAIFRNMFSKDISTKMTDSNGRGYLFRTNYYIKEVPLEIFIRDEGLISSSIPPTKDNMINTYHTIDFNNNLLNIRGTSFNIGANYATDQVVTRKIILENNETFERFEFESNYIDNGDYKIVLRLPDGLDKTRAWFDSNVDVSQLKSGTYVIYIKTKTGNIEDYGELTDIFMRELNKEVILGDKKVYLKLNKDKRMRLELVVEPIEIINDITSLRLDTNGINIEGWA